MHEHRFPIHLIRFDLDDNGPSTFLVEVADDDPERALDIARDALSDTLRNHPHAPAMAAPEISPTGLFTHRHGVIAARSE
jgi:hypothetical protein